MDIIITCPIITTVPRFPAFVQANTMATQKEFDPSSKDVRRVPNGLILW